MRISTRLLTNAVTTYGRLGATFLLGIFYAWYMVGQVGLVGYGAVALSAGSFGLAATFTYAIRMSVVREMAASLSTGIPERIQRTLTSSVAFTTLAAGAVLLFFLAIAGAAMLGLFRTPDDMPELRTVLAMLFGIEGVVIAVAMVVAPYSMALFASQRVWADNLLLVGRRAVNPIAAVVAFAWLAPGETLVVRLEAYALVRGALGLLQIAIEVAAAKLFVRHLRLRRAAFDRAEFRQVATTTWHTSQFTLASDLAPHMLMLVINLLFGLTYNGMWQIVIQVGGHARMIAGGVLHGIDPLAASFKEQGRMDALAALVERVFRYQLVVVLPFVCVYLVFLDPILRLWFGGRLARDEHLAAAGITVDAALALIGVMAACNLAAELFRASAYGLERILYGMGHVQSYAWFAKWSALIVVAGGFVLMWSMDSPIGAVIPLAIVQFVYFCIIVPVVAARKVGVTFGRVVGAGLPRPFLMTALIGLVMIGLRAAIPALTLPGLLGVAAVTTLVYVPLAFAIGMVQPERERMLEMVRRALGRRTACADS